MKRAVLFAAWAVVIACRSKPQPGAADACAPVTPATPSAAAPTAIPVTADGGTPPPFTYSITMNDPTHALAAEHSALTACVQSGLDQWAQYLTGKAELRVEIAVTAKTTTGRFAGASASTNVVGNCKHTPLPCKLGEDQAIRRLRTGKDSTSFPGEPDVRILVTADYWRNVLWMDPDPKARTATVPPDRDDAISVCTHELGHAFGMAGYRNLDTFAPAPQPGFGVLLSLYDDLVNVAPGSLTFEGPNTLAEFGPIPLTRLHGFENVYHYGNSAVPSSFDDKLMEGIVLDYGRRYFISRVDVRILQDLGVPIRALPAW